MIIHQHHFWQIETLKTDFLLHESTRGLELVYYGPKKPFDLSISSEEPFHDETHGSVGDFTYLRSIFSCAGDGCNQQPLVILEDEKGGFINRFVFVRAEVVAPLDPQDLPHSRDKKETLRLVYEDQLHGLLVEQFISTHEGSDVLSVFAVVSNHGSAFFHLKRLLSLQLDLLSEGADIVSLNGTYGLERQCNEVHLSAGNFRVESLNGSSSNKANPFFAFRNNDGLYYASNLIYSGNHLETIDVNAASRLHYLCGLHDAYFDASLKPGDSFASPEAVFLCASTLEEVTSSFHSFINQHILNPKFANRTRPLLVNTWEAVYFAFSRAKLEATARKAKELGLEMVVLDDGWFGHRNDDTSSLGDWFDNEKKTGGMANLSRYVHQQGLQFGFWVEPEMICEDSELYRAHPEYALTLPGLEPLRMRNQLIIDLVNPEVAEYLFERLSTLVSEIQPDYLKWDCNRVFTDYPRGGLYLFNYAKALYRLFARLGERFPNLLIESCSSGGNRFDLGMLYYTPQIWASDNTDGYDRSKIQEGTLIGYPQATIGCHVSHSPNGGTRRVLTLEDRFNIACIGAFGYELDITLFDQQTTSVIQKQISFYREHRALIQLGEYHQIGSAFKGDFFGWVIFSANHSQAMAMLALRDPKVEAMAHFTGFDETTRYDVSARPQSNVASPIHFFALGKTLNEGRLPFAGFFSETDQGENSLPLASRMFFIQKVSS